MPDQPEPTNPAGPFGERHGPTPEEVTAATSEPTACPSCQHAAHRPGTECAARVDHGRDFHLCLCLNLVTADRACPPLMRCQGGTLGYADIWHLQRARTVLGPDGVITPDVLTEVPAASGVQPDTRPASCACDGQTLLQVHTPTGCHDEAPARPVPDTERRERWAAAMAEAAGSKAFREPGREWDHMRSSWLGHADAAIPVADEEISEQWNRAEEAIRRAVAEYDKRQEVEQENARLRAELELAERVKRSAARDAAAALSAQIAAEAELEQARATTLIEAADVVDRRDDCDCGGCDTCIPRKLAAELRRMAAAGSGGQAEDGAQP